MHMHTHTYVTRVTRMIHYNYNYSQRNTYIHRFCTMASVTSIKSVCIPLFFFYYLLRFLRSGAGPHILFVGNGRHNSSNSAGPESKQMKIKIKTFKYCAMSCLCVVCHRRSTNILSDV